MLKVNAVSKLSTTRPEVRALAKITRNSYAIETKETQMSTIIPQSELVRKALAYIAEQRANATGKNLAALLDEAGMRFNLTPLDTAVLERLFDVDQSGAATPHP